MLLAKLLITAVWTQRFSLDVETNGKIHSLRLDISEDAAVVASRFVQVKAFTTFIRSSLLWQKANGLGTRAERTLKDAIQRRRAEWLESFLFSLPVAIDGVERSLRVRVHAGAENSHE